MAIYNPDGSEYKPSGSLAQFDPKNPEFNVFNVWDQEAIEMGGTPLYYYEVFINVNNIDELYVEARDKIYSQFPVIIHGYYEPIPCTNTLGTFGIDSPDEMMFEFNYRHVLKTLGHAPKIGARIFSPHKSENWIVIQRNTEVYKLWGELRLQVMCQRFQESLTTGEGKVTLNNQPDYKINSIKDLKANNGMNMAGGQTSIP
jgi:hypothetical protein